MVLAARGKAGLDQVAARLRSLGADAHVIPTDVSDHGSLHRLVEGTIERHGRLDVLVNNAGLNHRGPLERHRPEQLAAIVAVNLTAPIVLTRLALPYLRRSPAGAVVNVASLAGRVPVTHEATYSATKFGLRAFTMALAEELEHEPVHASIVSPGPVETGFILSDLDEVPDLVFSQPMSTARDIAAMILDSAADGALERTRPRVGATLATLGYVFPGLRKWLIPLLEFKGKRAKAKYRRGAEHARARQLAPFLRCEQPLRLAFPEGLPVYRGL